MLERAQTFQATTKVDFQSGIHNLPEPAAVSPWGRE
jgi:hypothetical protein